jgi:hypothetical protein
VRASWLFFHLAIAFARFPLGYIEAISCTPRDIESSIFAIGCQKNVATSDINGARKIAIECAPGRCPGKK